MCAQEQSIPLHELEQFLKDLFDACGNYDMLKIRSLLQNAQTGYLPNDEIGDVIWLQSENA